MPDISCMSPELLEEVIELLQESGAKKKEIDLLREIPPCEKGVIKVKKGRSGSGAKRAPSQYNLFIGDCMRGGNKTLAACSIEWKAKKK